MFSVGTWVALAIVGLFGFIAASRRPSSGTLYGPILRLLSILTAILAVSWICQVLNSPSFDWNQARLMPLFSWWHGYSLYYPSGAGPVLDAVYGPVSYLAYLPTLLAHSLTSALLLGSAVASFYFFVPVAWIFLSARRSRREARAIDLFMVVTFGLWTIGNPSLHYSCFNVHADAPSLGFAAVACGLLIPDDWSRRRVRRLLLSACFTALAIFTKQSLIFLIPVLVSFVWITDGVRWGLRFAALLVILSAVCFGISSSIFSAQALYFNLFAFPSHDGFGGGYLVLPEVSVRSSLAVLQRVAVRLWEPSRWPLLATAVCYVVEFRGSRPARIAAREWLQKNRWALFHFVALGGLPLSLYFGAKEGGDVNSFSLHLYFSFIGLLLFLRHLVAARETISRPAIAICVIFALTLVPAAVTTFDIPGLIRNLSATDSERVYQYARKHPGETYFSFFPLPVLMAEGRTYHFEYGLFHRQLGHVPVGQSQFLQYIPPHFKFVQREDKSSPIGGYLPQFSCETTQPGIADLHFYAECRGSGGKAEELKNRP